MKKIFYLFAIILLNISCSAKDIEVIVENTTSANRSPEIVEIPISAIEAKLKLKDGLAYAVKNNAGETIASQITADGKLIFLVQMEANSSQKFKITEDVAKTFDTKTFGRYVPERKEDFAWENDRVAFRIYGNELVATDGPSNGIDIWYKRTNNMVIDKWYKNDLDKTASYHEDHGEGLDDYKVGRSLGAGAMAPFVNDTLILNSNYISYQVIDNGPLRTTFKLVYNDLNVNGTILKESRTFSIDAGSQFSKIIQTYEGLTAPMDVAAGFSIHGASASTIVSPNNDYLIESEPNSDKASGVYVAVIFPDKFSKSVINSYVTENETTKKQTPYSHSLAVTQYQPNKPVVYYTGYGWDKFGFASVKDFENYSKQFVEQLAKPLKVKY